MPKTVKQLKDEILVQKWVSGAPENLILPVKEGVATPYDMMINEALAEIAKWVECERDNNVDVIPFCRTWFKCGMTIVPAPRGIIRRVFTIVKNESEEWCDLVTYEQKDMQAVECMVRNRLSFDQPDTTGKPKLPLGFKQAEASTDFIPDTDPAQRWERGRAGVWAIYDNKIYVGPWIQSNEVLVIDWKGIKTEWADTDLVNPDQDYKKAVKLYIDFAYERDYGDLQKARYFYEPGNGSRPPSGLFSDALADLMWECRERTKIRKSQSCPDERNRLLTELADDDPPDSNGSDPGGNGGSPPGDDEEPEPPAEPPCTDQLVQVSPDMTGSTTPSGVASASSEQLPAWMAFSLSPGWDSVNGDNVGAWIKYAFDAPTRIVAYDFRGAGVITHPKTWTFEGSNDDVFWDSLHIQSTPVDSSVALVRYTLASPATYRYYRWTVNSYAAGNPLFPFTAIARLALIDEQCL